MKILYVSHTIVRNFALVNENVVITKIRSGHRSRRRRSNGSGRGGRGRDRLRRACGNRGRRGFRGHVHVDDPGSGRGSGRGLFLEYLPDLGFGQTAAAPRENYEGGSRQRKCSHLQRLSAGVCKGSVQQCHPFALSLSKGESLVHGSTSSPRTGFPLPLWDCGDARHCTLWGWV